MFTDGFIFICNDLTADECFSNALFGAPRSGWSQVSEISDTTAIFLLKRCRNQSPIMYGVFIPHGRPKLNINPSAWKGKFPSQVRVRYYYKFSSSPMITFKTLLNGNRKSTRIGLQITQDETLYLITKFIINTRFHLSHMVKGLFGELGNESPPEWVDEKLQVHFSMCWLKKLACKDQVECRLRPEFMHQCGTLNDFINAIGIRGLGEDADDIIFYLRQDWHNFLKLVSKLEKTVGVNMAEINSLLSQRSLSIWPISCAIQIAAVKKWCRKPLVPSSVQAGTQCSAHKETFCRSNHCRQKCCHPSP